jgi:uncharacterized protein
MWTLITGASAGIGLELARIFARNGHDLVLVARNLAKLDQVAAELRSSKVQVEVVQKDLAQLVAADSLVRELQARGLEIEILVNNAGFAVYGPFLNTDPQDELDMLQVNMVVPTRLAKLLLPGMVQRGRGRILNVASLAAFQPGPLMAAYYATKAYLLHWSEAIANELEGTGVTVTALCPGATKTEFQDRAELGKTRLFSGGNVADARSVAQAGYDGLMRGDPVVVPGAYNKLLTIATRLTPRKMVTKITRGMQEERS